ncbi:MAG: cell division protein FtsQ/DivIB [Hyphomicrobiales bacterium]|nr:cell division protein FtsQ/DivIB [Hyphomicrobiales bacterium]
MRSVATLETKSDERPATGRSGRLVLPRFLRRPVRMILRRQWRVPRYAGLKGAAFLAVATGIAGVMIGGHSLTVVSAATTWAGLAIDEVEISGQSETSEVDVLEALAIEPHPSIVTLDALAARVRLETLPWIERATIRKLYPDTLQVAIVEREPYALWQHETAVSLVDKAGRIITEHVGGRYVALPMVVGEGAAAEARSYVSLLEEFPSLQPRVRAGVLVAGRRWNVVLKNGVEIMLPEEDPGSALIQVVALDDGHGILSREIAAVDLRLPNRLVFRLTETGHESRQALLKERKKKRPNA